MGRHLHTISLTDAEETILAAIREEGNSVKDGYRAGLDSYGAKKPPIIKTKEQAKTLMEVFGAGEYGCGCKRVEGKNLCPKHGRY
jgi:hypothetical protein